MKLARASAFFAALVVASTAMSHAPVAENLFPTSKGSTWVMHTIVPGQPAPLDAHVAVISEAKSGGTKTAVFEYKVNCVTIQAETYIVTADHVARRSSGKEGSSVLKPPMPIIEYPMKVGKNWSYHGTVTVPSAEGGQLELQSEATLKVAALEEVKTGAGTFKAYRVDLKGSVTGPDGSKQELVNSYWFAPNVGMVKQVATLPGISGEIVGTISSYSIK
ncbi:MAG TPA: hypothetical protein VHE55_16130 [Fimbriimonadaceae bacterium]|nr:hypothetical protein [Fimbriimonadaceae bacterium]